MPRKRGLQGSGQKILECGSSYLQELHCTDLSFVLSVFSLRASDTSILPHFAFHRVTSSSTSRRLELSRQALDQRAGRFLARRTGLFPASYPAFRPAS